MSKQQPSKAASKAAQGKKDNHDLTTILDESQRADITLLIANISESMRQLLIENFDAGKLSDPVWAPYWKHSKPDILLGTL